MNQAPEDFNFNEWIIENDLEDIKEFLIKHGTTTPQKLTFGSLEFRNLVLDQQLWTYTKSWIKLKHAIEYTFIWSKLQDIPDNERCLKVFAMKNENELVVIQYNRLCKYNIKRDEWFNWIVYPDEITLNVHRDFEQLSAAYNNDTNFIYIILKNERLLTIDLVSEKTKIIDTNLKNYYNFNTKRGENCIFFENKFHIIGHKKHFIFNDETNKFYLVKSNFPGDLSYFSLMHWKKRLFLMGGFGLFSRCRSIYSYSSLTNKWSKLQHDIAKPAMIHFGHIANESDIIIFGGYDPTMEPEMILSNPEPYNEIYLYNPERKWNINGWIQSSTRCPCPGSMHSVLVNNYTSSKLLTFGYLRKILKYKLLTDDLINLISLMSCIQNVHLLTHKGEHWKINLDHI